MSLIDKQPRKGEKKEQPMVASHIAKHRARSLESLEPMLHFDILFCTSSPLRHISTIFFFFLPERAGGRGEIFIHTVRLTHTLRICTHTHLHTCINQNFTLTNHCTQILYIYTHVCSLSLDTHLHVQGIEPQKRIHNTHTITI